MRHASIILQYVVVLRTLRQRNPLSDRHSIRKILVREFMQFRCVVWIMHDKPDAYAARDESFRHFGITNACPFDSGPMSRNEYLPESQVGTLGMSGPHDNSVSTSLKLGISPALHGGGQRASFKIEERAFDDFTEDTTRQATS